MHELVLYHEPCGSRDAHMQPSTTYTGAVGGTTLTTTNATDKRHRPLTIQKRRAIVHGRSQQMFTGVHSKCTMIASRPYLFARPFRGFIRGFICSVIA